MKQIRLCDNGNLKEVLDLCLDNDLGIEFQSFADSNLIGTEQSENLVLNHKTLINNFNGGKSLHAPFKNLCLGTDDLDDKKKIMKKINYAYEVAKELGCTEIVVHNGYNPNTSFHEGYVRRSVEFWKEFFSDKDDSITIMLENQNEEAAHLIKNIIDGVSDSRLKVCLDIGHAHSNSNMSVEQWITTLGDRIGYLHLHNNHGKQEKNMYTMYLNDEHFGLSNGTINMEGVLSLLEQYAPDAIWNIESKTEYLKDSISYLQEFGYLNKKYTK